MPLRCGHTYRACPRFGFTYARAYRGYEFTDILGGCHIPDNTYRVVARFLLCG